jgi:hypothetical protein
MTKDEALDLALEALENSVDLVREDAYNAEKLYGNHPSRQGKVRGLKVLADDHEKAITAIKQALAAQPAHVKVWEAEGYDSLMQEMQMVKARNIRQHAEIERLKAAQPAPVQPMAHIVGEIDHTGKVWKPVQPAPVQEPVAVTYKEVADTMNALWGGTLKQVQIATELANKKLYTTPPAAQPAVPDALTSADIEEHIEYVAGWNDCRAAMLEMMK